MKAMIVLCAACCLVGCAGVNYAHRTIGPVDQAAMDADSAAVRKAERAERAERRKERREEMMDQADAINRAYGNRNVYVIH